jgi:hypothetical protein
MRGLVPSIPASTLTDWKRFIYFTQFGYANVRSLASFSQKQAVTKPPIPVVET